MSDTEFNEPGRVELSYQIAQLQYHDHTKLHSSAAWAFLWLAELSRLQQLKIEHEVHLSKVSGDLASDDDDRTVQQEQSCMGALDEYFCLIIHRI